MLTKLKTGIAIDLLQSTLGVKAKTSTPDKEGNVLHVKASIAELRKHHIKALNIIADSIPAPMKVKRSGRGLTIIIGKEN